jgi:carbonic anhydrase
MKIIELLEDNRIFAGRIDKGTLKELVEKGQKPVATIVSCSDSRVPVEVIFNQLIPGAFFVIRVAGNVVSDASVKGSIEYAVTHLKTPYLVVLGHTECGAVEASLAGINEGEIGKLVSNMRLKSKDLDKAVIENLELQVKRVAEMDCVKDALDKGVLEVYGMLYDLSTGEVKCLSKNGYPCSGGLK